jgi:hypothetical protein
MEIRLKQLVFISVVGEFQNILLAMKSSQVISHEKLELVLNTFT